MLFLLQTAVVFAAEPDRIPDLETGGKISVESVMPEQDYSIHVTATKTGWYTLKTDATGSMSLTDSDNMEDYKWLAGGDNYEYNEKEIFTYKFIEGKNYTLSYYSESLPENKTTVFFELMESTQIARVEMSKPIKTNYVADADKDIDLTGLKIAIYNKANQKTEEIVLDEDYDPEEGDKNLQYIYVGQRNSDNTFAGKNAKVEISYKGETFSYDITLQSIPEVAKQK